MAYDGNLCRIYRTGFLSIADGYRTAESTYNHLNCIIVSLACGLCMDGSAWREICLFDKRNISKCLDSCDWKTSKNAFYDGIDVGCAGCTPYESEIVSHSLCAWNLPSSVPLLVLLLSGDQGNDYGGERKRIG